MVTAREDPSGEKARQSGICGLQALGFRGLRLDLGFMG